MEIYVNTPTCLILFEDGRMLCTVSMECCLRRNF